MSISRAGQHGTIRNIRLFCSSVKLLSKDKENFPKVSNSVGNADLQSILLSSKVKVSKQEINNVHKSIPISSSGGKSSANSEKTPNNNGRSSNNNHGNSSSSSAQKYQQEIINSKFIPAEIRQALTSQSKDTSKPKRGIKSRKTGAAASKKEKKAAVKPVRGTISVQNNDVEQVKAPDVDKIAKLAHNLDRTLFSPGVHFLQDPRTRVFNFSPNLKKIIKLENFDPDALSGFVSPSKDSRLFEEAQGQNKMFMSSTSSMTSVLTQFYMLLNNYNPKDKRRFDFSPFFQLTLKTPASVIVQYKGLDNNGEPIYSIESDKSTDQEIVLSAMGHVLEALLTNSEEDFAKFKKDGKDDKKSKDEVDSSTDNIYNYASYGKFLMRSQLDCFDERLPGNGTFDLKTRAVCAIRYDQANKDLNNNTYQIWKLRGKFESFQREYDDLIRTSALMKYGLQARIGQMDGIFLAYHNINSFFGFEYLPLEDIDKVFYSHQRKSIDPDIEDIKTLTDVKDSLPSYVANTQFKQSLQLWETMLTSIIKDITKGGENEKISFRLVVKAQLSGDDIVEAPYKYTNVGNYARLNIMAVPLEEKEVEMLQSLPKAFKTSFKDDIPAEEKLEQLKEHRNKVIEFSNTSSRYGVFNYRMTTRNLIDGKKASYPDSENQSWDLMYSFEKLDTNAQEYRRLMRLRAQQLVINFERALNEGLIEDIEGEEIVEEAEVEVEEDDELFDEGEGVERPAGTRTTPDSEKAVFSPVHKSDNTTIDETIECNVKNDMRVYSAIGKVRSKKWESLEYPPKLYKPRDI
ncbi:putative mitochondrial translation system component Pet127p [[Candida] railenensis]|uniref:Mitochondrial translation system component Pet127p n=1 Tax=[Candida] railenensis TaxID=45579 RepID=A0A9P0QLV3_9ASCO|nr:putative mitochondrial translation system component Pet127p [[Candida] railenensis]